MGPSQTLTFLGAGDIAASWPAHQPYIKIKGVAELQAVPESLRYLTIYSTILTIFGIIGLSLREAARRSRCVVSHLALSSTPCSTQPSYRALLLQPSNPPIL